MRELGHPAEFDRYCAVMTIDALVTEAVMDDAYAWLCRRRARYPASADIWSFRRWWPAEKARLRADLQAGRYQFNILERVARSDGEALDLDTKITCLTPSMPLEIGGRPARAAG